MALDNPQVSLYNRHTLNNQYEEVSGVYEMPLAISLATLEGLQPSSRATTKTVRMVRLHAPYMRRTVTFASTKNGNPPVIPAPSETDGLSLTGAAWNLPHPTINPNQTNYDYNISGAYQYVESIFHPYGIGFCLGTAPFSTPTEVAASTLGGVGVGAATGGAVGGALGGDQTVIQALQSSKQINFASPYWSYEYQTYFSPVFFDTFHISGDFAKMVSYLPQIYTETDNLATIVPPRS